MAIHVEKNKEGKKIYTVYCDGVDKRGKRIQLRRRGLSTEREAKAVEFELKRQIANQKDQAPNYTWNEWFEICLDRMRVELKPSTIMEYIGKQNVWFKPTVGEKFLSDITTQDVHDVIYNREFDVTWYTRSSALRKINRIFQMALDDGIVQCNPSKRIRVKVPEARKTVLNRVEIDKLLLEAKKVDHRFYDVWVLAVMTGMRSGELHALKWSDVCFDLEIVRIQRSWTSKNGLGTTKNARCRVLPISGELDRFLKELKLKGSDPEGQVLPRLQEWSRGDQAQVLKDFCRGIGITPIKFHDLRATFITQMLANGVSLAHVMAMVGHAEIKTTQGYLRLAGIELKGTTEVLGITLPTLTAGKILKFGFEGGRVSPTRPYQG